MVFNDPQINNFIEFSKNIFEFTIKNKYNEFYLVEYNSKSKGKFPSVVKKILKNYVLDSNDIDFITLPDINKKKKKIVIYKKKSYQEVLVKLGSLVASKLNVGDWKLNSNLNKKDECNFALGWGLQQYKFNNIKNCNKLKLSKNIKYDKLISILSGTFYGKE